MRVVSHDCLSARAAFGVLASVWLFTACPGEATYPCCPRITAIAVSDPWICPAGCPGGGKTRATLRVEFWKGNERCAPATEARFSIKNVTDNIDLGDFVVKNAGQGIFDGVMDLTLQHDTDFDVTVVGDGQLCQRASGKLRVDVVDDGDFAKVCFSGPLTCNSAGSNQNVAHQPAGPGVMIEGVENLDSLKVGVKKDKTTDHLPPYTRGTGLAGLEFNGPWAVWLETENDCKIYNQRTPDTQNLCLRVYLRCNCR